jgi:hypothetical protein
VVYSVTKIWSVLPSPSETNRHSIQDAVMLNTYSRRPYQFEHGTYILSSWFLLSELRWLFPLTTFKQTEYPSWHTSAAQVWSNPASKTFAKPTRPPHLRQAPPTFISILRHEPYMSSSVSPNSSDRHISETVNKLSLLSVTTPLVKKMI